MKVLTIDNKYADGDRSHFFFELDGVWVAMFKPELTLRHFLERLLMAGDWDEDGQFDIPEGGMSALIKAAAEPDAEHFFNMLTRWDKNEGMLTSFGDWEVAYEQLQACCLGPRELGTMLAALRLYQDSNESLKDAHQVSDIATNCGEFEALDCAEIAALCDKLN
jgi:hypothetical protein